MGTAADVARAPSSPLLHLIVNNLGATAHSLYMHGMYFVVINYADYISTS